MKVELNNGQRFVANFRYNAKPTLTMDPIEDQQRLLAADIHSGDYGSFDSDCKQTMVGFVQSVPGLGGSTGTLQAHPVQCFHATQDKYMDIEGTETMGNANTFKYAKITRHSASPLVEVTKVGDDSTPSPSTAAPAQPTKQQSLPQTDDEDGDPHPDSKPPMPKQAAV